MNSGESGGRLGGSSRRGDDNQNSCSQGGNLQHTKSESANKDKGIFILNKLSYFKSVKNPDGVSHLPKVTVGGKEAQFCVKGSSKDRVCTNNKCTFTYIFILAKITNGVSKLNTWTFDTDGVK